MSNVLVIVTIGIGAGKGTCDGEVAVFHNLVGGFPWFVPGFAKQRADIATDISRAIREYMADVKRPD